MTVGQEIVKLELGAALSTENVGGSKSEAQDSSSRDQDPAPQQQSREDAKPEPNKAQQPTAKDDSVPPQNRPTAPPPDEQTAEQPKAARDAHAGAAPRSKSEQDAAPSTGVSSGSRQERRACLSHHGNQESGLIAGR